VRSQVCSWSLVCALIFVRGLVAAAPSADAQVPTKPVVAHLALGWGEPIHDLKEDFEAGWLISGGATFHVDPTVPVGMRIDLGYARFGVEPRTTLSDLTVTNVEDGYTSVGNLSLDGLYEFGGKGRVGGYVGGGVGGYSRYQTVTQKVIRNPGFCDPLVQVCVTTTTVSTESSRLTKIGFDAGAALTFPLRSAGEIYFEARYHFMNSDPASEYVPISVGYRW
jgi:hypothetical protein